ALLRGINVGGNRKVPMTDLAETVRAMGYGQVRTHINSGNVLLTSDEDEVTVVDRLERALDDRFGFAIGVVARDATDLARVAARDPFPGHPASHEHVYVTFLDQPAGPAVEALARPDVIVEGREVYALLDRGAMAKGQGPMTAIERAASRVTTRNMTTVRKLAEMTGE
ncbi:MAG: DUF1697 domain-containing protein, partial [Chloroflexota bacterium]|nr:DUF1697 domain-containing protein [Chloroflexota bacterium]